MVNYIKTNKVRKEPYLVRQDNTIYKCSIKISFVILIISVNYITNLMKEN